MLCDTVSPFSGPSAQRPGISVLVTRRSSHEVTPPARMVTEEGWCPAFQPSLPFTSLSTAGACLCAIPQKLNRSPVTAGWRTGLHDTQPGTSGNPNMCPAGRVSPWHLCDLTAGHGELQHGSHSWSCTLSLSGTFQVLESAEKSQGNGTDVTLS